MSERQTEEGQHTKTVIVESMHEVQVDRVDEWIEANALPGDIIRVMGEKPAEVERVIEYE